MKTETFIGKIISAIENEKPTTIKFNNKTFRITKQIINSYKDKKINDLDDDKIKEIGEVKEGGILPLLPLIFGAIAAAGAVAGGASGIAKAVQDKKATDKAQTETERHNKVLEKYVNPTESNPVTKGSGFNDILGTIKEFGKIFTNETKRSVKNGLLDLAGKVKIEKQGEGIYLSPYKKGDALYLNPYKG